MQHGKSWEGVESGLGLGVRTSGALILQRKKSPEYGRRRLPRPAGRMFTLFVQTQLLPLILIVQHRVEIRESQVGDAARILLRVSFPSEGGWREEKLSLESS